MMNPSVYEGFQVTSAKRDLDPEAWLRLAKFLGPAWAEEKVSVNESGGTSFSTDGKNIRLPQWTSRKLIASGMDEQDSFRLYRHGLWHETQHVKLSPPAYVALKELGRADTTTNYQPILNIFEDNRITEDGLKTWPGMESEQAFVEEWAYNMRPQVEANLIQGSPMPRGFSSSNMDSSSAAKMELLTQKYLLRRLKTDDPAKVEAFLKPAVERMDKAKAQLKKVDSRKEQTKIIKDMAEDVVKMLGLKGEKGRAGSFKDNQTGEEMQVDYNKGAKDQGDDITGSAPDHARKAGEETKKNLKQKKEKADKQREEIEKQLDKAEEALEKGEDDAKEKVAEELEKEMEAEKEGPREEAPSEKEDEAEKSDPSERLRGIKKRLEKKIEEAVKEASKAGEELEGDNSVNQDWETVSQTHSQKLSPGVNKWPASSDKDLSRLRNRTLTIRLIKQFEKLGGGFETVYGKTGEEFEVERRLARQAPFSSSRTVAPYRKVVMVIDGSGSTCGMLDDYKRTILATGQALEKLGFETSTYALTGNTVYKLKDRKEQFHVAAPRIASLHSSGGTPLAHTYKILEPEIAKSRPNVLITLTDGAPTDSAEGVRGMLTRYKRHYRVRSTAYHIESRIPPEDKESIRRMMKTRLGYDDAHIISAEKMLTELPAKILQGMGEAD